jgi:hypothetical protein
MKLFLIVLAVVFGLVVGGLTYVGVMPGLSPLFAQARDLGVVADVKMAEALMEEHQLVNALPGGVVPAEREPQYSGSKEINVTLSNEQISSVFKYWKAQYAKTPVRDVQVRIGADGSGEASGILELGTAIAMAKTLGYSDEQIAQAQQYAGLVAGDIPFYLQGTASVTDNQVSINPSIVTLGRVTLPAALAEQAAAAATDAIERKLDQIPNLMVDSLTLSDGGVKFAGTIPDTVE